MLGALGHLGVRVLRRLLELDHGRRAQILQAPLGLLALLHRLRPQLLDELPRVLNRRTRQRNPHQEDSHRVYLLDAPFGRKRWTSPAASSPAPRSARQRSSRWPTPCSENISSPRRSAPSPTTGSRASTRSGGT